MRIGWIDRLRNEGDGLSKREGGRKYFKVPKARRLKREGIVELRDTKEIVGYRMLEIDIPRRVQHVRAEAV